MRYQSFSLVFRNPDITLYCMVQNRKEALRSVKAEQGCSNSELLIFGNSNKLVYCVPRSGERIYTNLVVTCDVVLWASCAHKRELIKRTGGRASNNVTFSDYVTFSFETMVTASKLVP